MGIIKYIAFLGALVGMGAVVHYKYRVWGGDVPTHAQTSLKTYVVVQVPGEDCNKRSGPAADASETPVRRSYRGAVWAHVQDDGEWRQLRYGRDLFWVRAACTQTVSQFLSRS